MRQRTAGEETMAMSVIDCDTHYWEPVSVWSDYIDPRSPTERRRSCTTGTAC